MGIPSVVPDMDVTAPASLTADALGAAVLAVNATLVFASPSALANVVATAGDLSQVHREAFSGIRLLLCAGAPVSPDILRSCRDLMPNAEAHTPYGMTEVLPVADITLAEIDAAGEGNGVCVGRPLPSVEVAIDPIDPLGVPSGSMSMNAGVVGEVCIRAPHMKDGYDRLWRTEDLSATGSGWHRSGDVGHFDDEGRLWIEGRLVHVVSTASGVVTPIGVEHRIAKVAGIRRAAIVGVGPKGTQQVVAVVEPDHHMGRRASLATLELLDDLRANAGVAIAAAFVVPHLPVDKRHNAKIDRSRLAAWASEVLAGGRMRQP
jgi:acyl-CoA synthetase (AMP-forming)/AMP-acid ligase II